MLNYSSFTTVFLMTTLRLNMRLPTLNIFAICRFQHPFLMCCLTYMYIYVILYQFEVCFIWYSMACFMSGDCYNIENSLYVPPNCIEITTLYVKFRISVVFSNIKPWHWADFHITDPLWRKSIGHQWFPQTKGQQCGALMVCLLSTSASYWINRCRWIEAR